jgi:hypothetical protein
MQGVHEIQVALRKYEFSPGTLHVRKGEQVKLVMAAVDHDHGFRQPTLTSIRKSPRGRRLSSNSPLTRLALSNFAARMSVA